MERVAAQMTSLLHMKGIFVKEQSVKNTYLWSTLLVANNSLMYTYSTNRLSITVLRAITVLHCLWLQVNNTIQD